jgi:hypothetical protein
MEDNELLTEWSKTLSMTQGIGHVCIPENGEITPSKHAIVGHVVMVTWNVERLHRLSTPIDIFKPDNVIFAKVSSCLDFDEDKRL